MFCVANSKDINNHKDSLVENILYKVSAQSIRVYMPELRLGSANRNNRLK